MHKLPHSFYLDPDVVTVSKTLLGKVLFTDIGGKVTAGVITETEAYAGVTDKASHAHGGRRTPRTEIMFWQGGTAYVYLCYGIHSLFNVVTNVEGIPHAVLVRAIYPVIGTATVLERRKKGKLDDKTGVGPGNVGVALGLHYSHSGKSLSGNEIWVEDHGIIFPESSIQTGPRIGVGYAAEDALLPYRFWVDPKFAGRFIREYSHFPLNEH